MANWPASLPQYVLRQGFTERPQDETERSEMDTGPAKVRRRFTAAIVNYQMSVALSAAQMVTFKNFFTATLSGGSVSFDWVRPVDQTAAVFRFVGPVAYAPRGRGRFTATFKMEELP